MIITTTITMHFLVKKKSDGFESQPHREKHSNPAGLCNYAMRALARLWQIGKFSAAQPIYKDILQNSKRKAKDHPEKK